MPDLGFNCRTERDKWRAGGIVHSKRASFDTCSSGMHTSKCARQTRTDSILGRSLTRLYSCTLSKLAFARVVWPTPSGWQAVKLPLQRVVFPQASPPFFHAWAVEPQGLKQLLATSITCGVLLLTQSTFNCKYPPSLLVDYILAVCCVVAETNNTEPYLPSQQTNILLVQSRSKRSN